MYILVAIAFIAELIIAFSLINLILKADRKVCELTEYVRAFNPLAGTYMRYVRCVSNIFCENVARSIEFVKKKHEQIIFRTITTVAIYSILVLFKVRKIKPVKVYRLVGAIRDLAMDLAI